MIKLAIRGFMLAVLLFGSAMISHAQQSDEDKARAEAIEELEQLKQQKQQADEQARQQAESEKQRQAEAEASKPKTPRKVFRPTEEISEDSPAPFPVDI